MSEENEESIIDELAKLLPMVKILLGGAGAIGTALIGVGIWVYTQQNANTTQDKEITELKPRVASLENWKLVRDSSPVVTLQDLHAMDKRLSTQEDKLATIKEQNALILETLKRLEAKM